jgi:hypothetical protein
MCGFPDRAATPEIPKHCVDRCVTPDETIDSASKPF